MSEQREEELAVIEMPVKPGEVAAITAQVRHGRPTGGVEGYYGVIEIPGIAHPMVVGPHPTHEAADEALRTRLAEMSAQISAQGIRNEVCELSDDGRN